MSFKRVGDDYSAIKVQKKLRVSELLLEDIPEDEAALAKNGRFVCLVCGRRPVFDTVAMLSIHRQGKKHLAAAAIKLEEQREIAELQQKREHDKYLKELQTLTGKSKEDDEAPLLQRTQKNKELVLNPQHRTSSVEHSYQQQQASSSRSQKNIPFFQSRVDTKVNFWTPTTSSQCSHLQGENPKELMSDSRVKEVNVESECKSSDRQDKKETLHKRVDKQEQSHSARGDTGSDDNKRKLSEYYARLRASGWILGTDGNWQKDETVEFDSDEDEPPPPPDV